MRPIRSLIILIALIIAFGVGTYYGGRSYGRIGDWRRLRLYLRALCTRRYKLHPMIRTRRGARMAAFSFGSDQAGQLIVAKHTRRAEKGCRKAISWLRSGLEVAFRLPAVRAFPTPQDGQPVF